MAAPARTSAPFRSGHRQRLRGASVAVLAALLSLLVGCGEAAPTSSAPTTDPAAWAGKFCDALVSLQDLPNPRKVSTSDPKILATKLGEVADGLQKATEDLDKAGTPPSQAAVDVVAKFKEAFGIARDALRAAQTKIETLKKDSAGIAAAAKERDKAVAAFNEAGKKLNDLGNDQELDKLLRSTPSCQKLGASSTAATAPKSPGATAPRSSSPTTRR